MTVTRASRGANLTRLFRTCVRASEAEGATRIAGVGAPYDEWTVLYENDRMVWRERYAAGCFDDSIADRNQIVQSCFNHKRDVLLASTRNGTLTLDSTTDALEYVARLDLDDPDAQRVLAKIRSGLVDGASCSFRVSDEDESIESRTYKKDKRWFYDDTLKRCILYEVGPVTDPAYENTSAGLRARDKIAEYDAFVRSLKG